MAHSVRAIIRHLLDDGAAPGQANPALDVHLSAIQRLAEARRAGQDIGRIWQNLCRDSPELRDLVCGDPDEDRLLTTWQRQTLRISDIFAGPLDPPRWVVDRMIPRPGLVCVYGPSGDHKTNLLYDLATCVATGTPWLTGDGDVGTAGLPTSKMPVLIADFDMGEMRIKERLRAFARGHGVKIPDGTLTVLCSDQPFSLSDPASVDEFGAYAKRTGAGLVILDTLADVTSGLDENSAEMGTALGRLRQVVLSVDVCLVLVTHSRKADPRAPGSIADALRGSSAINAKLDLGLQVTRGKDPGTVDVNRGKCRGPEVHPFSARFVARSDPSTGALYEAAYRWTRNPAEDKRVPIEAVVRSALAGGKELSKRQLALAVVERRVASDKTVRGVIDHLVREGALRVRVDGRSHMLSLAPAT